MTPQDSVDQCHLDIMYENSCFRTVVSSQRCWWLLRPVLTSVIIMSGMKLLFQVSGQFQEVLVTIQASVDQCNHHVRY